MSERCEKCGQDLYGKSVYMDVDIPYCHDCAFHKLAKEYLKKEEEKGNLFLEEDGREIEPIEWVEWFLMEEIEQELDKMEIPATFE